MTALTILFYSLSTILILFVLGAGLTLLSIPNKLKSYSFWLSPWYAMFFLIFFLVIFSLFGLSVKQISPFLIIFLLTLTAFALIKKRLKYTINAKEYIIIAILMISSIILNTSPLIKRTKLLTTLSFGNNDVVVYAALSDYFTNHSIAESYVFKNDSLKPSARGFNEMIKENFRWGSPIIVSFFLNIFKLQGYQYLYLFETILFSLVFPLVYLLFKIIYKSTFFGLILCLFLFAFNVNLLYILYHDFLGQVFFWGIELFLLIFLYSYFSSPDVKNKIFTQYDFIIGSTTTVLFYSYHEAAIFIVIPIFLSLFFRLILKSDFINCSKAIIRTFFITLVTSFISIIHAIRIDFIQIGGIDDPIGWQLFRNKLPFANPFEAMGFFNIHSFEPIPLAISLFVSFIVILFIIYGFAKSKFKVVSLSFLIIYGMFYIWTTAIHSNFWAYNRALTYTLPLIIVLFSIGVSKFYENRKNFGILLIILFVCLEVFSSLKLNKRFLREFLSVDGSLISLKELDQNTKIYEPIFTEQTITGPINIWRQFWTDYFLYPNKSIYTPFNINKTKDSIADESLILISKFSSLNNNPPKIVFNKIEWENEHYILGRLCNSDKCLLSRNEDLSKISVGKNEYEDSLLFSGWGIKEGETRWANEKESTLRLVTKDTYPVNLTVEALSLGKPQEMSVYLNDELLGKVSIDTEWKSFSLPIPYPLGPGVHKIKFIYSNGYRPMDVIPGNLDGRTLYVNFKKIALK